MITGNIKTYKSCGMTTADFDKYLDVLRSVTTDTADGEYELDGGAFYIVSTPTLAPADTKVFESHKKYIDIQYILEGTEQMEYADLQTLTVTQPYSEEGDCALETGKGVMLTLNAGDFAVFCPEDGHKPGCGVGTSRKVIVKVPVK